MHARLTVIADELGISSGLPTARNLREYDEAEQLEIAEAGTDGREYWLISPAAEAWRNLQAAAGFDGISLNIISAFRSVEHQAAIIRRKLNAGICIADILTILAPPGFSEHHSGRAVHISTPGTPPAVLDFEQTAAFAWLMAHANRFGFYLSYPPGNPEGYRYESWHWCFHPVQPVTPTDLTQQSV